MFKILGLRKGEFKNENQQLIKWRKMYLLDESKKDFDLGGLPFNVSLPEEIYQELLGYGKDLFMQNLNVLFDQYGKVSKVELI